ncbi:MAG: hypothetical protein H8E26_02405 [FCB group bacterium]|nr:hypothetical protein [FCB group bacterium]MBL7027384.1 hypothetical protein [Candidatus Neomarinimicrobiota bacterium]MBL7122665.1 hypothetical protein [Candidatus Neomarinimicrobiota bacterium]
MKFILLIAFLLGFLLLGCTDPDSHKDDLKIDQAFVTIENIQITTQAFWGSRILASTEYEQIRMEISDSVYIDILNLKYTEGVTTWQKGETSPEGILFSLYERFYGGSMYMVQDGLLNIQWRTDSAISGSFDVMVYNMASSCYDCPEYERYLEGEFMVAID